MANFTIQDKDGNSTTVTIPDFSLESTQALVLANIKQLVKGDKQVIDALNDVANNSKGANAGDKDAASKQQQSQKTLIEESKKNRTSMGQGFKNLTTGIGRGIGGTLATFAKGMIALGSVVTGVATARFVTLGGALTELTKVGLSQRDSTIQTITSLNLLGFSTNEAVQSMVNNSRAFATMGKSVSATVASVQQLTNYGLNLGTGLEELNDIIIEELNTRARLTNVTSLSAKQLERQTKNIAETTQKQVEYAQALGVSTDTIRTFVQTLIDDNGYFTASLLTMNKDAQENVIKGTTLFASVLRASAGEVGGEIAAAVLEAAQGGAIGFSDAAVDMIQVLPRLAGIMNSAINDFDDEFKNAENIARQFTTELANLSQSERDRIFLLARAGDEMAKSMAKAVVASENAAENLNKLGLDIDDAQKAMLAFASVTKRFKGMMDGIITIITVEFGKVMGQGAPLEDTLTALNNATTLVAQSFTGLVRAVLKSFDFFGKTSTDAGKEVKTFADAIKYYSSYITGYMDRITDRLNAGESLWDIITTWWNQSKAKKTFDSIAEWIKTKLKDATTYVTDTVFAKIKDMMTMLSDKETWRPVFKGISEALKVGIAGLFTWDNMQKMVFGTATPMADAKNYIIDKKDDAIKTVSDATNSVTAPIKNVINKVSDFFGPEKDQATPNDSRPPVTTLNDVLPGAGGTNFKDDQKATQDEKERNNIIKEQADILTKANTESINIVVDGKSPANIPVTPAVSTTTATAAKANTDTATSKGPLEKQYDSQIEALKELVHETRKMLVKATATDQTMKTLTEAIATQDKNMNDHLKNIATNTKNTATAVTA